MDEIIKTDLGQPTDAPVETDNALNPGPKNILGKFHTVDDLAKAYENLQVEFTKKCQALSQIQQGTAGAAIELTPKVEQPTQTPTVNRDEVIQEYLLSVARGNRAPTVITAAGDFAFGVKPEPKTLLETEKIAENFFKSKERIK